MTCTPLGGFRLGHYRQTLNKQQRFRFDILTFLRKRVFLGRMRTMSYQQRRGGRCDAVAAMVLWAALFAGGCVGLTHDPGPPPVAAIPVVVSSVSTNVSREEYRIREGDVIRIQVSREDDLSGDFTVLQGGVIAHPLLGRVGIGGMTVIEAERSLAGALKKDYLVNPRVLVQVRSSVARRVVVLGEVKQPGIYELAIGDRFTLLQAVAKAGGFTDLASIDKVTIVRKDKAGERVIKVKVSDLLSGQGGGDIELMPDDVIRIPQTIF